MHVHYTQKKVHIQHEIRGRNLHKFYTLFNKIHGNCSLRIMRKQKPPSNSAVSILLCVLLLKFLLGDGDVLLESFHLAGVVRAEVGTENIVLPLGEVNITLGTVVVV